MEATIGFNHVWWCFCHEAPILKMFREIYHLRICQCVLGRMGDSSDGFATTPTLHKFVSASLNPAKPWFAVNSSLCCTVDIRLISICKAVLKQIHADSFTGFAQRRWISRFFKVVFEQWMEREGTCSNSLWPSPRHLEVEISRQLPIP